MGIPKMISYKLGLVFAIFSSTNGGITIPKENCRWVGASDWNTELKCDGNQVAVGSCSGGGGFGHKDCPGGTVHQIKCCDMAEFYYSNCNTFNSDYGQPIDCRDHGDTLILEGQCHSGQHHDCHGSANLVSCCQGHYEGSDVAHQPVYLGVLRPRPADGMWA